MRIHKSNWNHEHQQINDFRAESIVIFWFVLTDTCNLTLCFSGWQKMCAEALNICKLRYSI